MLLPSGWPFRVGNNLALLPVDALRLATDGSHGVVTIHNGGGDFVGVGCNFKLAQEQAGLLLATSSALHAVVATLSPRSRAASVQTRPKPRDAPVMNQVFFVCGRGVVVCGRDENLSGELNIVKI